AGSSGGLPAGRVATCSKPSTPCAMKRACERQSVGLPLPVCLWIAIVPTPAALSSTIRARHTCFCGLFPDPITASSRSRSSGPSRTLMPFLIQPDSHTREPAGIIRQRLSTRNLLPLLTRGQFDLIHIDGGHSAAVSHSDLAAVMKIAKPNSVILFDDSHAEYIAHFIQFYIAAGSLTPE